MNVGSRLTVKAYPVTELCYGDENRVTVDGRMTVCKNIADKILAQEPLIKEIDIRIIMPDEHQQHTNTAVSYTHLSELAVATDFTQKNLPPGAGHLFGTDWMGRDMLARTLKGLSLSIFLGILAAGASACTVSYTHLDVYKRQSFLL